MPVRPVGDCACNQKILPRAVDQRSSSLPSSQYSQPTHDRQGIDEQSHLITTGDEHLIAIVRRTRAIIGSPKWRLRRLKDIPRTIAHHHLSTQFHSMFTADKGACFT